MALCPGTSGAPASLTAADSDRRVSEEAAMSATHDPEVVDWLAGIKAEHDAPEAIEGRTRRLMAERAQMKLRFDTRADRARLLGLIDDALDEWLRAR